MKRAYRISKVDPGLRHLAEQPIPYDISAVAPPTTAAEALALVHKLQVQQIEMEMQNDELRRAHLELESLEERYRELYDFAPVGYLGLDSGDRILEANLWGAALLGIDRQHLIDRLLHTFLSASSQPVYRLFVRRLEETGVRQTCEFDLLLNDGAIKHLQAEGISAEALPEGGRRILLAIMDITERRRMEQVSQDSAQQYQSNFDNVFDEGPLGIAFVDLNSRFLHANKQFGNMVGYTSEELLSMSTHDIIHPADILDAKENARIQLEGGLANVARETRYHRKNGEVFWARTLVTLMRDSQNNPMQFLEMIEDITQQKMAEQSRLAAIVQERTRIAHDIHDTLAQGFTGILIQLQAAAYAPEQEQSRVHIAQASDLARQSLQEARRSVQALRPQALEGENLAGALTQLVAHVGLTASTSVHLLVHGAPRSLPSNAEDHIFRIGQEAVTNAIKHSNAAEITIDLWFELDQVRLSVTDNGNGFDATAGFQGSGFGLIGMSERAHQIGAEMTLDSHPGTGTCITVAMPGAPLNLVKSAS